MSETAEAEVPQALTRISVPALDAILGKPFKVLDQGFIRVVDYMGSDAAIIQAARVSYGEGTKKLSEDAGLINYLMRHRHTTPFEMAEVKLHVRVPMDCWRQWIRHRTANVNEYSTRYSVAIDEKQKTSPDAWRLQSTGNKQGSSGKLEVWPDGLPDEKSPPMYLRDSLRERLLAGTPGEYLSRREESLHEFAKEIYEERVDRFGIAREQARKDLPLSTYTEAYWKCDLHNLLHFLGLRMDSHAQLEIRECATLIGEEIVSKWCPLVWSAFQRYGLNSMRLSEIEQALICCINSGGSAQALAAARAAGWLEVKHEATDVTPVILKENRERAEFEKKAFVLGIDLPWVPKQS